MSFLNNPNYSSIKVILLLVVVAGLGFFVYKGMQTSPLENTGRVINTSKTATNPPPIEACIPASGVYPGANNGDSCTVVSAACHSSTGTTCSGGGLNGSPIQSGCQLTAGGNCWYNIAGGHIGDSMGNTFSPTQ